MSRTRAAAVVRAGKVALFLIALIPLGGLLMGLLTGGLGANPVETITHRSGDWALRLLLATLALTPLRELTGWHRLLLFRRMLGLFAFFYACLHLMTWLVFDHALELAGMLDDVLERPYITFGMSAFCLLLPLALTSTDGWIRRLGRRWKQLHRLVYPAAIVAVLHFLWLVKADLQEPLIYAAVLSLLLSWRLLPLRLRRKLGRRPQRPAPTPRFAPTLRQPRPDAARPG